MSTNSNSMSPDKLEALRALGLDVDEVWSDEDFEAKEFDDGIESLEDGGVWAWHGDEETGRYIRLKDMAGSSGDLSTQIEDLFHEYHDEDPEGALQLLVALLQYAKENQAGGADSTDQSMIQTQAEPSEKLRPHETNASEIQRTIEKILKKGPNSKQKSYDPRPSRLVGGGDSWFDQFMTGQSIKQKGNESLDDYLDGLDVPDVSEDWFDRWLEGRG